MYHHMNYNLYSISVVEQALIHVRVGSNRGDNGELRVGVRRRARQLTSMPSSVISSQSMHLGVLATASHAVTTQTRFVVYYKPRYSCFLIIEVINILIGVD